MLAWGDIAVIAIYGLLVDATRRDVLWHGWREIGPGRVVVARVHHGMIPVVFTGR